jgi:hypothetical protein
MLSIDEERVRWLRMRAQGLLRRKGEGAEQAAGVVKGIVGVQAQESPAAALSIRARSQGMVAAEVRWALEEERTLVRGWFMRSTLHLVAAEDVGWLLGLLGPVFIRQGRRRRRELGLDEATSAKGVELMQAILGHHGPLTRAEIAAQLAPHGIRLEGQAIIHLIALATVQGVVCLGPERDGEPTYGLMAAWLGRPEELPVEEAKAELVRRYLAAYGPARPEDLAAWSGLPIGEVRTAWQVSTPELVEVRFQEKAAWMLKNQAGWLDEPPPAGPVVRLLPRYDTYLLGYQDRELTVAPEQARKIHPGGGIIHPTVLVDGRAAGTWQMKRPSGRLKVVVEPFGEVTPEVYGLLEVEVADIGRFLNLPSSLQVVAG